MDKAGTLFRGGNGCTLALLLLLLIGVGLPAPVAAAAGTAHGEVQGLANLDGSTTGSHEASGLGADGSQYVTSGLLDQAAVCADGEEEGCTPAVVELGDRVWLDENGDGSQDANEPGFYGLVVNAYIRDIGGSYMLRATTVTDRDGHYRFTRLEPATTYYIVVEGVNHEVAAADLIGGLAGPSIGNAMYRVNTATGGSELPWAGYPYYEYTVGAGGEVNHDLDFAFAPEPVNAPTAITWNVSGARGLLQSPFLSALLLLTVLLGSLWLVLRALVFRRLSA